MQRLLYKYLLLHHSLNIPSLGSFRVIYQPAYINESTGLLFPRRPVIEFNEVAVTAADKELISFLATEMQVNEETAAKELQNFSITLLVSMVEEHSADLDGIGRIRKESNGQVIFFPASNLIDLLPPLRLQEQTDLGKRLAAEPAESVAATETIVPQTVNEESVPVQEVSKPANTSQSVPKPVTPPAAKETRPARALRPETQKELDELIALKNEASRISTAKVVEMKTTTETEEETEGFRTQKWHIYAAALAGAGLIAILIHAVIDK